MTYKEAKVRIVQASDEGKWWEVIKLIIKFGMVLLEYLNEHKAIKKGKNQYWKAIDENGVTQWACSGDYNDFDHYNEVIKFNPFYKMKPITHEEYLNQ